MSTSSNTSTLASSPLILRRAWPMAAAPAPTRSDLMVAYLDRTLALKPTEKIELLFDSLPAASLFRFSLMNHRKSHPRGAEIQIALRSKPQVKVILTRLPFPIAERIIRSEEAPNGATP